MAKTIRKTIQITTRKRNNSVKINEEFYSYDKKNAQFEFLMDYDIPADKVIALFHFENSNRYYETLCQFKGNLITIDFDTSLIEEDELVTGYLYFDKLDKSTDVYRFTFGVRLSEIDKTRELPVEEKVSRRIVPVADIVTKQELEELMDKIKKNGGTYDDTDIRNSIASISERVQTLENKPDNDTRYDDSDVKSRLNVLETNASKYLTEHQPLTSVEERIQQVEARFNNLSNIYLSSHQSLEHLATNDALGKIEQRVKKLEAIDVTNFATKQELDALSNSQPSIENRLTALENKPTVDTTVFAKKTELYNDSALTERVSLLEAKAIANGAYDDKPLLDKIHALEDKSNAAITAHQSLEHLVTRKDLEDKHYLSSVPEEYARKTDLYNDSELRNKITQLETNSVTKEKVESVENRVQALENKSVVTHEELESAGYAKKTELYNDSELREKITALETNSVTHSELASKNYLVEHQPLTDYATNSKVEAVESRVLALENKPTVVPQAYDDSALSGRVSALEAKEDKDTIYNDEEIKRRLTTLEGKTDNFITGVSVNKEGSNVTLTYNYVDGQTKNVSFTDSDTVNVAYDDSGLKQRITNLENRPQIDVNTLVSKTELPNLIQHQSLEEYAKKSELPAPYNDSALVSRINVLEAKTDNDTVYDDSEVKRRLTELEARPTGTPYNDKLLSDRVKVLEDAPKVDATEYNSFKENAAHTVDVIRNRLSNVEKVLFARPSIPTLSLNDNTLSISGGNSVTLPTRQSEMRGTGMPNGVVEAPIGTNYIDTAKTNGALKWIKTTDGGNTGWKVLIGDTGWRNLKIVSQYGNSYVKIRRINNNVMYHFGSLENGNFGTLGRSDVGVVVLKGQERYEIIIVDVDGIPQGFRTENSVIGQFFYTTGNVRGMYHVRGTSDGNFLSFRSLNTWPTAPYIYNLMININYCTDDDWPTTLP